MSASSVLVSTGSPTLEEIRSLRRPIKSIDQTGQTAPLVQSSYTLPFPDTSDTSDTSLSLGASLSQLYRSKTTARPEIIPVPCTNDSATPNSTLCNKSAVPISNLNINTTQIQTEAETISTSTVSSSSISTSTTQVLNVSKDQVNSTLASVIVTKELVSVKEEIPSSDQSQSSNLSPVSITGISFAVIIIAALVAATSFVMYRRRYLNKPQTLNDKCSNPDSSGYIDDSTMRVSFFKLKLR